MPASPPLPDRLDCSTGIAGLDFVLCGGIPRNRFCVVQGNPGVGKTTIGLQFLLEGRERGESGLFITLSESLEELTEVAASHGWTLDGLHIFELASLQEHIDIDAQSTLFHPSEVELSKVSGVLMGEIERVKPARIVFDSLSELRLLSQNPLRFRRQLLSLKQFLAGRDCTTLVMDDRVADESDLEVQSIAHAVIRLELMAPDYGDERRRLSVVKVRGRRFRGGYHDYVIRQGGMVVFPRLVAADHRSETELTHLSSDLPGLDALLNGGLASGTSTLIMGPPGTGKSTLSAKFAVAAARRGQKVLAYVFDEKLETFARRSDTLGMEWSTHVERGTIEVSQIDPSEVSPGELAHRIRESVEREPIAMVLIDSLNGYLNSMPEERFLTAQMHEMLMYLGQRGVATILLLAQSGLIGAMQSPVDITYLADTVLILRYFESDGAVKQAVSVIKKRSGNHERTIREYKIVENGIEIGEPLREFRGVLTGVPSYDGSRKSLTGTSEVATKPA
jgi:circadian clock protein KaiC